MMDSIVCFMEMGLAEQVVLFPDGARISVPTKKLPLYLVSFARCYENYSLELIGQYDYAEHLAELIKEEETKQYNTNLIEIKIIGGKKNNE